MADIADLIEHYPDESKLVYSTVQVCLLRRTSLRPYIFFMKAEMNARLAELAIQKEDYDKALELLTQAQSLRSVCTVQDSEIISLVGRGLVRHGVC